jgi:ectoine hydroxylase-related dioxygenase (phytanoyl-CoA dioxygenase family)
MTAPAIQYVKTNTAFEDIAAILDRDGLICVKEVLPKGGLNTLREELDPYFERAKFCEGPFVGAMTKRVNKLVVKSAVARDMIIHSLILKIMDHILDPFCDKILLNITQGIQIWPGQRAQVIHTDDVMYPMKRYEHELMADVMWAYSDFTKENGATIVVPGSHKWNDRNRIPKEEECVQAEMKAGDALIYVGSLLHNGGANKSNKPRTGLLISYCLGWLRQFENQFLVAPPHIAKTFKKELQEVLGYTIHRPNLGQVDGNDPSLLLTSAHHEEMPTRDWLKPVGYDLIEKAQALEDAGQKLPDTLEDLIKMH